MITRRMIKNLIHLCFVPDHNVCNGVCRSTFLISQAPQEASTLTLFTLTQLKQNTEMSIRGIEQEMKVNKLLSVNSIASTVTHFHTLLSSIYT